MRPAPSAAQAQAGLQRLRERIGRIQQQLRQARRRESRLADELSQAEQAMGRLREALRRLDRQRRLGQQALAQLRRRAERLQSRLDGQRRQLARALRSAYLFGRQPALRLLLNEDDPGHFGRILTYYRYLGEAEARRIARTRALLDELARVRADIRQQVAAAARLRVEKADRLQALAKEQVRRDRLLARIRTDIARRGSELKRLQADRARLQRLLRDLRRYLAEIPQLEAVERPFRSLKAHLPWPVQGGLLARFGQGRAQGRLRWNGVLIAAKRGTPVRAVAHGRVVFADWLRGFGLLMIIDHGDGYMSLYGHNDALYRAVGDWVEAGDEIAVVGDSGGLARPALYFELRYRGAPLNPLRWCAGSPRRRAG